MPVLHIEGTDSEDRRQKLIQIRPSLGVYPAILEKALARLSLENESTYHGSSYPLELQSNFTLIYPPRRPQPGPSALDLPLGRTEKRNVLRSGM